MAATDKTDVDYLQQAIQEVADEQSGRMDTQVKFSDLLNVHRRAQEIKKRSGQ